MKRRTKRILICSEALAFVLAVPRIVAASLADWLLWGSVACTVAGIVSVFTPAAPIAPVLGAVEVVGIIGGVLTHPAVTGVEQANATFNSVDEKMMMAEFLVTDLAMLDLPTEQEEEYAPIFAQVNAAIEEYNVFRQDMQAGSDYTTIATDLLVLADAIYVLADRIAESDVDITVASGDMNAALGSIESDGLPAFELDHLTRSGFSQDAIDAFLGLHATSSPSGNGFAEPTSLSEAVRNVADRFTDIAIELLNGTEPVPGDAVVEVIVATPQ